MARQGVTYRTFMEAMMVADAQDHGTRDPARWRDHGRDHDARQHHHDARISQESRGKRRRRRFRGGWFHTGDLAVRHPNGYVEVKDRAKDIIISGGENISSLEVEECLFRHPKIMEAAVVARPDDHWGETVCAFVTPRDGAADLTEDEVVAWCRERIARYKTPRTVVFGPLPKTSTGKIQKFVLRERAKSL